MTSTSLFKKLLTLTTLLCALLILSGCAPTSSDEFDEYIGEWYRIPYDSEDVEILAISENSISYYEPSSGNAIEDWDVSDKFSFDLDNDTFEMKNGHTLTINSFDEHALYVSIDDEDELSFFDSEDRAYADWKKYQQSDEALMDLSLCGASWITGEGNSIATLTFYEDLLTYTDSDAEPVKGFEAQNEFTYDAKSKTFQLANGITFKIESRSEKNDSETLTISINGESKTFSREF